jgi:hypothetical protein
MLDQAITPQIVGLLANLHRLLHRNGAMSGQIAQLQGREI